MARSKSSRRWLAEHFDERRAAGARSRVRWSRRLESVLGGTAADLVLSDMAPNISGMATVDQAKAMYLAELALEFARSHLKPGGDLVVKFVQGSDFDSYVREVRSLFARVQVIKPRASRPRSKEVYLLARDRQVK